MAHYEVGFKLRHGCLFNSLSQRYPSTSLAWWSNYDQDILEATYKESDVPEKYEEDLALIIGQMGGTVVRRAYTNSKLQLVIGWDGTKWEYSTSRIFMKHNCLVLHPTIHQGGWEWYRIVAFSEKDMRALFKELDSTGIVEITSKKTVEEGAVSDESAITTSSLVGGLTGKQSEALVLAIDYGYYAVPKRATTQEVASKLGLPRTTFEERLRKAESKVLLSVAPYMQFSVRRQKNRVTVDRPSTEQSD